MNGSTEKSSSQSLKPLRVNPPVLMNERKLVVFIGISPRSVRNFTARGLLPVIRLGRRRLYRRDSVMAVLVRLEIPGSDR